MCRARTCSSRTSVYVKWELIFLLLGSLISGCQPAAVTPATSTTKPAAKSAGPSKVSGPVKETDLAKVALTEDAEKHLGILDPGGLFTVERKPLAKAVSYPGEVMIPSGHLISVTSPFAATLKAPQGASVPQPGAVVSLGQVIFLTEPNLSPGERHPGFRPG